MPVEQQQSICFSRSRPDLLPAHGPLQTGTMFCLISSEQSYNYKGLPTNRFLEERPKGREGNLFSISPLPAPPHSWTLYRGAGSNTVANRVLSGIFEDLRSTFMRSIPKSWYLHPSALTASCGDHCVFCTPQGLWTRTPQLVVGAVCPDLSIWPV